MLHYCPLQATKCFAYADVANSAAHSFANNFETSAGTVFNFGSGRVEASTSQEGSAKAEATATTAKGGNADVGQGGSADTLSGVSPKTLLIGAGILAAVGGLILYHHYNK